jgi:hypothetical protein
MVMNELVTVPHVFRFDGDRIRVFDIDGHRLAVAPDLCAVLGLTNTTKAVANLDDHDKVTICRSDTLTIISGYLGAIRSPGSGGHSDHRGWRDRPDPGVA